MSEQTPTPEAPQPPQAPAAAAPQVPAQPSFGQAPSAAESFGSVPAAPEKKKKGPLGAIIGVVVAVVVVGVLALAYAFFSGALNKDAVSNAKVGDCFQETAFTEKLEDASGEKTVACTDPTAKYKVVGIVDNKRSSEIDVDTNCAPWADAVAGIWLGPPGEVGKVYCVSEVK